MEPTPVSTEGFLNPDTVVGEFGITKGMRIADFGCGAGHIGILAAQQVGKDGLVIAFDIMEDKLDSMKARAKASGLENIQTTRANLEVAGSTGLADGTQDLVLLINILFQSTKKADILKEATRVLKSGGQMIVVDWKKGGGGFGPPNDLRTESSEMQSLCVTQGVSLVRPFTAGQFHYGLIFKK